MNELAHILVLSGLRVATNLDADQPCAWQTANDFRYASNAQVRAFNRGHVRHAHRWIFAAQEVDWASELLAQPSVAPKVLDMSTRDLMHFQSVVAYDPRIDEVEETK